MQIDTHSLPITWIEYLPKDCIDIVRSHLSQLDFASVLNELEIATNSERNWVHDCNNIRPFGSSPVASLDNVKEYITSKFCYRVEPYLQVTELFRAFENANDNYYSKSPVVIKLCEFVEYQLSTIHQIVRNLRKDYFTNVAVPVDIASRIGARCWVNTEAGFWHYVHQDAVVASYRELVSGLLYEMMYNCGHLRKLRSAINEYQKELYRIA